MKNLFVALSLAIAAALGGLSGGVSSTFAAAEQSGPSLNPGAEVPGATVAQTALQYVGSRYVARGSMPETGFDNIGFAVFVYGSQGIRFPRSYKKELASAPGVTRADLQPGDALYFKNVTKPGISHVGIYIGDGKFIHAEWFGIGVRVSSLTGDERDGNYWETHYLAANRPWSTTSHGSTSV